MESPIEIFTIPFMRQALVASLLVAAMCSFVGIYVIIKRIVFVGIAIAQVASLGIALGFFLGLDLHLCSFLLTGLAVLFFALFSQRRQDNVIGIVFVLASALAILLLSKSARGESDALRLLFGHILAVSNLQIWLLVAVLVIVGFIHIIFQKEFIFISFDEEMASSMGFHTRAWELLFYATLGAVITVAVSCAGLMMVFALLVIPPTVALSIGRSFKGFFTISVVTGLACSTLGLYLAYLLDLPAAASIVLTCGVTLFLLPAAKLLSTTAFR